MFVIYKRKVMVKKNTNKKIKKLKQTHDNKISEAQEIEKKIINEVFDKYLDEDVQMQLINDAKTFHYSETKILNVQEIFKNFTTNNFQYNTASDIIEMETHIEEHKKEGFFSKIANIAISKEE